MTKDKDEDNETTSEDYEDKATEALEKNDTAQANVYATLALMVTVREASIVFGEIIQDIFEGDDDEDDAGEVQEEQRRWVRAKPHLHGIIRSLKSKRKEARHERVPKGQSKKEH